jgi:hypothetical protein
MAAPVIRAVVARIIVITSGKMLQNERRRRPAGMRTTPPFAEPCLRQLQDYTGESVTELAMEQVWIE